MTVGTDDDDNDADDDGGVGQQLQQKIQYKQYSYNTNNIIQRLFLLHLRTLRNMSSEAHQNQELGILSPHTVSKLSTDE